MISYKTKQMLWSVVFIAVVITAVYLSYDVGFGKGYYQSAEDGSDFQKALLPENECWFQFSKGRDAVSMPVANKPLQDVCYTIGGQQQCFIVENRCDFLAKGECERTSEVVDFDCTWQDFSRTCICR